MAKFPRIFDIVCSSRDQDLEEKNIQPENFEDGIIFLSMFTDFLWKTDDENCISNAEKVKNYAKKFYQGIGRFWVQGRKRDGMVTLTINKGSGVAQPTKWYNDSKETGHPIFTSTSALSRGILKQKRGRSTIHFNGDTVNTKLLFQTVRSVDQIISIKRNDSPVVQDIGIQSNQYW